MNIKKKALLVLIGCILAFFICECFLYLFNFEVFPSINKNDDFDFNKFIKWAYIDIHNPFFKKENNFFYIQREDIWIPRQKIKKYSIIKEKNKIRVFILGESVARIYPEEILKQELSKYFDNVEVINTGMGAYDSYRIEKISKEISKLNPNYVIVCIGNNDGVRDSWNRTEIDPVDINYLPYKYSILNKFKTIGLLSNLFYHEIKLTKDNVELNFQKNITKIVKNLKNINVIFCDLPNNEYFENIDIIENIKQTVSKELYYKKIWKNSFQYSHFLKRIEFLKKISKKYKNVYITNLTDIIKNYTDNKLGFNVFYDDCHFLKATYLLLSKLITNIIVKKEKNLELSLDLQKKEYNILLIDNIERHIKNVSVGKTYHYNCFYNKLDILYKNRNKKFYENYHIAYDEFIKNRTHINYMRVILYADILQNNKKIMEAKEILNKLIILSPNNFEAYLILGYIEYKNNNFKKADEYFYKVKEINKNSDIDVKLLNMLSQEN